MIPARSLVLNDRAPLYILSVVAEARRKSACDLIHHDNNDMQDTSITITLENHEATLELDEF